LIESLDYKEKGS